MKYFIMSTIKGVKMNIENSIRELQKNIKKMLREKKMVCDLQIVKSLLIDDEWGQDKIEKIRDEKGGIKDEK